MNPSVNRSTDSPKSSGETLPEVSSVQPPHPALSNGNSQNVTNSSTTTDSAGTMPSDVQRQQPIPPPSEPMQYRAIGLIRGKYMPSQEQLTRGTLLADDGTLIDAVLLGRVMSLVKNHLDLTLSHLWVVYPRTRQQDGNLHVQIVGVWEPETLNPDQTTASESTDSPPEESTPEAQTSPAHAQPEPTEQLPEGYFSIRGQVIYQSRENEDVIVKIKQSPRRDSEKTKFFKLQLKGLLGEKVINHFWDLHVKLHTNTLMIEAGNDIGIVRSPKKRSRKNSRSRKGSRYQKGSSRRGSGEAPGKSPAPKRSEPLSKPVQRKDKSGKGNSSSES